MAREFEGQLTQGPGGLVVIGSFETRNRQQDFLRRLFNNNNPEYFFLPNQPDIGITEDYCVILALAISVKVAHYDDLLAARRAQLDDLYQAKLGWQLGQQWSRVGTPDWPEEALRQKAETVTFRADPTWFPDREHSALKKVIAELDPNEPLSPEKLTQLRKKLPSRVDEAIDALFLVLISEKFLVPEQDKVKPKLRQILKNHPQFSSYFR